MLKAIQINFHVAVLVSIIGGVLVLFKPELVFAETMQIYGPLTRNLLLIVGYLVVIQVLLWGFRYRQSGYFEAMVMGALFLLTALGIPFYSYFNGMPLSVPLVLALGYCGLSHLAYFAWAYIRFRDQEENKRS